MSSESDPTNEPFDDALMVARMYYHLGVPTTAIARQLGISRPTVSRLLSWAKSNGLVEFRITDPRGRRLAVERSLESRFGLHTVKIVPLPPDSSVSDRQRQLAVFSAHYLNSIVVPGTTIALAWGATISLVAKSLLPKPLPGITIVQMNGSGNSGHGITYAANIVSDFARNYAAATKLLPIPAYFDDPATKSAMFRERSIRRVLESVAAASIAVFSIGVPDADSYVYRAGYVADGELAELREDGVVGDIATVFFRSDGSYKDIAMNQRSSGPDLGQLGAHQNSICVVAGEKKLEGVRGALKGGFCNTLIIDQPTAEVLAGE